MSAEEVCRERFLRRWFEEEDPVDLEFSKSSVWGSLSCARRNSYMYFLEVETKAIYTDLI
jgi:hypothetical protein